MTSHLTVPDLKARLAELELPTDGKRAELQKRLRKALAKAKQAEEEEARRTQEGAHQDKGPWRPKIRNFLVTDVEATCESDDKGGGFGYPNESEWARQHAHGFEQRRLTLRNVRRRSQSSNSQSSSCV